MNFLHGLVQWMIVVLVIVLLTHVQSHHHMLHYYKLKKFLTAVAFAKALGKKPRILPVPIPIPIPIAQNEIIKLPLPVGGKTMVLGGGSGVAKQPTGVKHVLGGTLGSSTYGYAQPTVNTGTLQPIPGSDNNAIGLSSFLGNGASNDSPNIIILGGQNSGNALSQLMSPTLPFQTFGGLGNFNQNFGSQFGNGVTDLETAFSFKPPGVYKFPQNLYSDRPRRKMPFRFGRRNQAEMDFVHRQTLKTNPRKTEHFETDHRESSFSKGASYPSKVIYNRPDANKNESQESTKKRPIPVGEKFDARPYN